MLKNIVPVQLSKPVKSQHYKLVTAYTFPLRFCLRSLLAGTNSVQSERRNPSLHGVNEDFEHRPSVIGNGAVYLGQLLKEKRHQQGISLIEIIVVITILSVLAAVLMPDLSSDYKKLDLAAAEVAQAIRFARQESIRTSVSHGVKLNTSNDSVKVYRLPSFSPSYDVYHPVKKRLYTLNLKTDSATAGVELQSYAIYYGGSSFNQPYLGFNTNGNPKYSFFGTDYMLDSAVMTLAYGGQTRNINVSPMTGRVTVQ